MSAMMDTSRPLPTSPSHSSGRKPGEAQDEGDKAGRQPGEVVRLMALRCEKPIANPVVVLREEFDDWAVLFNPDTADAVGINPVGVATWKLIDGHRTVKDLTAEISDRFAEVPETAGEEVSAFIEELAQRGFVGYDMHGFTP
jgi:SynChlorMet cassette protein ScmD